MAANQNVPQPQEIATMAAASLDEDPLPGANRKNESDNSTTAVPSLVEEEEKDKESRLKYYRQLYLASLKGDWESAQVYFKDNLPDVHKKKITLKGMNALLVASCNGQTKFVEKLLEMKNMPEEGLTMSTWAGYTALHHAAMGGHLKMAKALVRKNRGLTQFQDVLGNTPLLCAVISFAKHKLVRYLATVTEIEVPECPFTRCKAGDLMINLTHMGYHDISLYLIRRHPSLALAASSDGETILQVLAYEPANFLSGTKLHFWQRWIYKFCDDEDDSALENQSQPSEANAQGIKYTLWGAIKKLVKASMLPCINNVREKKVGHKRACKLVEKCLEALHDSDKTAEWKLDYFKDHEILHNAARCGVVEVVTLSLDYFPDLIFTKPGSLLLKTAIEWRQVKIFNLVCKSTTLDKMLATQCYDPSISNLVAQIPMNPQFSDHSNAATLMQREFQWFKEIESIEHPRLRQLIGEGKKDFDLFSENRKEMRANAETWMKDTSNSTMIVATLITTVAFAGVFTVPGGTDEHGTPNLHNDTSFKVFVYSDAIALFSSVTSVLMFLSILTSNYREQDFGRALPKRMLIGLASLFLAFATMMVAYAAGLQILLRERFRWAWGPIIVLAAFPVTLFIMLQLPLFFDMVQSTYCTIFRREKIWKSTSHCNRCSLI